MTPRILGSSGQLSDGLALFSVDERHLNDDRAPEDAIAMALARHLAPDQAALVPLAERTVYVEAFAKAADDIEKRGARDVRIVDFGAGIMSYELAGRRRITHIRVVRLADSGVAP